MATQDGSSDAETGQYYYRARYYDAGVGKFISEDPTRFLAEQANLYRYGDNSPVNFTDPSGLIATKLIGADIGGSLDLGLQLTTNGGDISKVDWASVAVSTATGSLGVGLTAKIASLSTSAGKLIAWNAAGNAVLGAGDRMVRNALEGNCLGDNVLASTLVGGALGAAGEGVSTAWEGLGSLGRQGLARYALAQRLSGFTSEIGSIRIYRGTRHTLEINTLGESGYAMSDATRIAYIESRYGGATIEESLQAAQTALQIAHTNQLQIWGSLDNYVQAHGAFGAEINIFGPRSMISFTIDSEVAQSFAKGGIIMYADVPQTIVIPQTLPGAGESEVLIEHMTKVRY